MLVSSFFLLFVLNGGQTLRLAKIDYVSARNTLTRSVKLVQISIKKTPCGSGKYELALDNLREARIAQDVVLERIAEMRKKEPKEKLGTFDKRMKKFIHGLRLWEIDDAEKNLNSLPVKHCLL